MESNENTTMNVAEEQSAEQSIEQNDKIVPMPGPDPEEAESVEKIAQYVEAGQKESDALPEELREVALDLFRKQFSNGLRVGANAICAVVYGKIGNGKINFEQATHEELVDILNGIDSFCQTGMSTEFIDLLTDDGKLEADKAPVEETTENAETAEVAGEKEEDKQDE